MITFLILNYVKGFYAVDETGSLCFSFGTMEIDWKAHFCKNR